MFDVPTWAELRRRLPRLIPGLLMVGVGLGVMVQARLGLGPWEVLHQGVSEQTGVAIGTVGMLIGFLVLFAWIPLRQRVGVGTVVNVVVIGLTINVVVDNTPEPSSLVVRAVMFGSGIVLCGLGSALYIGAGLGAGPRDGVMTALGDRGYPIGVVRTAIELGALGLGALLGGNVGVGTVAFALLIGPIVHVALPRCQLRELTPTLTLPAE